MLPLTQDLINKNSPNGPGIYKIYLCNLKGESMTIQRAFRKDERGLIYIGVSKTNLKNRLSMFRQVSSPESTSTGHFGAQKYRELKPRLDKLFPDHQLYFEFEPLIDAVASKEMESKLLTSVRFELGETPMLNG